MAIHTTNREASKDEMAREIDRCHAVIEKLEAQIAGRNGALSTAQRALVRSFNRIHCLPRTSDTELATAIEQALVKIREATNG